MLCDDLERWDGMGGVEGDGREAQEGGDICIHMPWFFQWSCMGVRVGLERKLSTKELMLLNCGVGEDS